MPPTINVQHCALKSTSKKAQDEAIAAAIKALQSLVDEGNAASVLQLLSNQGVGALKEMLNDIIRPHIFNNETVRVDRQRGTKSGTRRTDGRTDGRTV